MKENSRRYKIIHKKWFYPFVYITILLIAFIPPITEIPYPPQDTQVVIIQIMRYAIPTDLFQWGWIFHIFTLLLVVLAAFKIPNSGRWFAAYFGFNYLIIALVQSNAVTPDFGFALQIGALIADILLGLLWILVAVRGIISADFQRKPIWRWFLLPFALLVFWSPLRIQNGGIFPHFDPLLLLMSADYGFTYCFMTPVFLFFLILFYPHVPVFALRVTAFNGFVYALFNLTHWFDPQTRWMGVMHLPLLIMSIAALWQTRTRNQSIRQT